MPGVTSLEQWKKSVTTRPSDHHAENRTAASRAPEICVEVLPDGNTLPEIERKAALYFARGAKEVWVCDEGRMRFYVAGIALDASQLAPKFPPQVHLPE